MTRLPIAALLAFAATVAPLPAAAAQKTVVLSVLGMNCAACPITVRKALEKVSGVAAVKATLEPPEARVTFDDSVTSTEQLTQATRNAGYPATVKAGN